MKLTLVIEMESTGETRVTGPINNKGLCYSMLELARDVIRDHVEKQAKTSGLVTAQPGDLANLKGAQHA